MCNIDNNIRLRNIINTMCNIDNNIRLRNIINTMCNIDNNIRLRNINACTIIILTYISITSYVLIIHIIRNMIYSRAP